MQRKVQSFSRQLADNLSSWPGVEAVLLAETAEPQALDPYFILQLEVLHRGVLPAAEERRRRFESPTAFEAVPGLSEAQDRFLSEVLPVRVRYQDVQQLEGQLARVDANRWTPHEEGTRPFYRLVRGRVLFERGPWLGEVRQRLGQLPDTFWARLKDQALSSTSYALHDLQASVLRGDALGYVLFLAQFLRSLAAFLFALNRCFEPPARLLAGELLSLPRLPDGFAGRFESLLREEPELTKERKREVAELLARSVIKME
jgi:hypothetical protein